MPPKAKITKKMILSTVLNITRKTGFEAVNARSIACKLQCSTRPIFTCYENMDKLKEEFLDYAFDFYHQYVIDYSHTATVKASLLLPLSYIEFARKEPLLFQYLFINDMDLNMAEANDFYRESGNEQKAKKFLDTIGVELEHAKAIFLDLFLYTHGIAVLAATGKLSLDQKHTEEMLQNVLSALIGKKSSAGGE